ncbi:MAG: flagellar MS-ring protein, partial [Rhizobacter sp.]|nr:flagellar MS-ring protein [Rhizobacter sp.]
SLSNRPVAVAASSPAEASTAQKNATTRQYAYDRTITQIKRSRGRLARLSVAVALNNHAAPGGKGTWTPAEITGVENMLRSGLGINAERGDKLSVSAFSFPVPPPVEPWWQQRDNVIDIGSGVLWTIGSLFGFLLIVRPVLRLMQQQFSRAPSTSTELAMLPAGAAAAGTGSVTPLTEVTQIDAAGNPTSAKASASGSPSLALPGVDTAPTDVSPMPVIPLLENYDLPPPGSPVDVLVDHLKVLAAKEPERVAEVVKQWVQKHGQPD